MEILEPLGDALLEAVVIAFAEVLEGGSSEPKCKVQTLFGNDVWWNF